MDALELLSHYRNVEPADETVIVAAAMAVLDAPDLDHSARRRPRQVDARSHQRWSRRRTLTGVAAAAVAVAGAGALLAAGPGAPRAEHAAAPARAHDAGGTPRPATPSHPTPARLLAEVSAAMQSVSGDVFYVHQVSDNGWTYDDWTTSNGDSSRSDAYAPGGALDRTLVQRITGDVDDATIIDYADQAWWTTTTPTNSVPSPASDPMPANCTPATCGWSDTNPIPVIPVSSATPPDMPPLPAAGPGVTVVAGTQVVDGDDTTEVTETLGQPGAVRSYYIDQATDLPVRVVSTGDSLPGNNYQYDMSWLPPTAVNLALLTASPPAAFTHSATPIQPPLPPGGGVG